MANDAQGNPIDLQAIRAKKAERCFVVVDDLRKMGNDDAGPVVSNHRTWDAAAKAAKKNHRYRVFRISRSLEIGDHVNPFTDIVVSNTARFS